MNSRDTPNSRRPSSWRSSGGSAKSLRARPSSVVTSRSRSGSAWRRSCRERQSAGVAPKRGAKPWGAGLAARAGRPQTAAASHAGVATRTLRRLVGLDMAGAIVGQKGTGWLCHRLRGHTAHCLAPSLTPPHDGHNMTTIMQTASTRKALSHERIVEVACKAIRRVGYRGVGVADIMQEAGLTHGGFYAHFASREAMLVEAMHRAGVDNEAALTEAVARRVARGRSGFAALVGAYLHDSNLDRPEQGCVVAALASEMARQGDAVREAARQRVQALVALVAAALPAGTS